MPAYRLFSDAFLVLSDIINFDTVCERVCSKTSLSNPSLFKSSSRRTVANREITITTETIRSAERILQPTAAADRLAYTVANRNSEDSRTNPEFGGFKALGRRGESVYRCWFAYPETQQSRNIWRMKTFREKLSVRALNNGTRRT